jgi:hypothetical protein
MACMMRRGARLASGSLQPDPVCPAQRSTCLLPASQQTPLQALQHTAGRVSTAAHSRPRQHCSTQQAVSALQHTAGRVSTALQPPCPWYHHSPPTCIMRDRKT